MVDFEYHLKLSTLGISSLIYFLTVEGTNKIYVVSCAFSMHIVKLQTPVPSSCHCWFCRLVQRNEYARMVMVCCSH